MKKKGIIWILAAAVLLGGCQKENRDNGTETGLTAAKSEDSEAEREKEDAAKEAKDDGDEEAVRGGEWEEEPFILGDLKIKGAGAFGKDVPQMSKSDYPVVDGSTATLPLSQGLYRLVTGATQEEAERDIRHYKTTNAYYSLLWDRADLVIAYEPSEEFYKTMEESDEKLVIQPIGKDALVFLTNEGNPVQSLTEQQIVDIYSGKIDNWSEVGGADREIAAFQRPSDSGSQNLMEKLVMKGTAMAEAPTTRVAGEMGELMDAVASYNNDENALGYSVYFYARNMYEVPGLRFMAVNQVEPDNRTIKSGKYPYVNEFYAAVREDSPKDSAEYRLFQWLTEDAGQAYIESLGYVAVNDVETEEEGGLLESEVFDGMMELEDEERIAVDGMYALGTPGTLLIHRDKEHMKLIRDYTMDDNRTDPVALMRIDQPVIVKKETADSYAYGVRDLPGNRWILPPEYNYITRIGNGLGRADSRDTREYFDEDWNPILKLDYSQNISISETDHYIWRTNKEQNKSEIYDLEGKLVRTVDFTPYGTYDYMVAGPICSVSMNGAGTVLYQEDGSIFLDMNMIPQEIIAQMSVEPGKSPYIESRNKMGRIVNLRCGNQQFAYDSQEKRLLNAPGEDVWFWDGIFSITRGTQVSLYDENGIPLKTNSGASFNGYLENGCFYSLQNNTITVGDGIGGQEYVYRGTFDDSTNVRKYGRLIMIETGPENQRELYIYDMDQLIAGGKDITCEYYESSISIVDKKTDEIIYYDYAGMPIDDDGEQILAEDERFRAVSRGNYFCLSDSQGRTVVKLLTGYMAND
ncbi:substrate-binding domain-containing protein [Clostridium sp. AM58-1XD]|uniref:PstS family phosphate ABC transporter substrate-binding protein n=1 Tax=Clostridium sp. AM58-1XD TaxID=2292307 RepID=UPI000E4D35C4|nr:substrate-binding domain-containing protein [Clostridium sp. AM58-1XD]RGZ01784.1 hypothetical protein DXA13_00185 [Clostridium sp. AM58-1XD]